MEVSVGPYGRSCIASRDLSIGEVVLREDAALLWSTTTDEIDSLQMAYSNASVETRAAVDGLSSSIEHIDKALQLVLDSSVQKARQAREGMFPLNPQQAKSLTLRAHLNAHQVSCGAAFFPNAAIFNHSCSPSSFYTIEGHTIRFTTIRAHLKGEEITAPYLPVEYLLRPKHMRQAVLQKTKGFQCGCARCEENDESWTKSCPIPQCAGSVSLNQKGQNIAPCVTCGHTPNELWIAMLKTNLRDLENSLLDAIDGLYHNEAIKPDDLLKLHRNASDELSPGHFITRGFQLLIVERSRLYPKRISLWHAFDYANWTIQQFAITVPANLIGGMTSAIAELIDAKLETIEAGPPVDDVLRILQDVLPVAKAAYGNEAGYCQTIERIISKYQLCGAKGCKVSRGLSRCGRCQSTDYCSRACQVADYKLRHKAFCTAVVGMRAAWQPQPCEV